MDKNTISKNPFFDSILASMKVTEKELENFKKNSKETDTEIDKNVTYFVDCSIKFKT